MKWLFMRRRAGPDLEQNAEEGPLIECCALVIITTVPLLMPAIHNGGNLKYWCQREVSFH